MQRLEEQANKGGLSYEKMMHQAGIGLADMVAERYHNCPVKEVLGLVGSGNNGGDTLVALTRLMDLGWKAKAYIVKERSAADSELNVFQKRGGEVFTHKNDERLVELRKLIRDAYILLDGVLGTGFKRPLRGRIAEVLMAVTQIEDLPHIIAVDCPSGVDCDSGEVADECIPAEWTITMAAVKQGLLRFPAFKYVGEISVVKIGLPSKLPTWHEINVFMVDDVFVKHNLPARPLNAHKGTFGTAMIVAGSINFVGAAYLAGKAAYRIGAGLVKMAVPGSIFDTIAGQLPEATWIILPETLGVINNDAVKVVREDMNKVTALLLGPGWGQEEETLEFFETLLFSRDKFTQVPAIGFVVKKAKKLVKNRNNLPPLVIDADALKLLTRIPDWYLYLENSTVLTPHPGEMAVLTGLDIASIQADRIEIARTYANKWKKIVVLKGALTVIANPQGEAVVIPCATPALARAGTGDVLAGMIAGLIAQGMSSYKASIVAAWLHARAGKEAERRIGYSASVLASDVLDSIPIVLEKFKYKRQAF